jgi:hypothetical protein
VSLVANPEVIASGLLLLSLREASLHPEAVATILSSITPGTIATLAVGYEGSRKMGGLPGFTYGVLATSLALTPPGEGSFSVSLAGVEVPVSSQIAGLMMLAGLGIVEVFDFASNIPTLGSKVKPQGTEGEIYEKIRKEMPLVIM